MEKTLAELWGPTMADRVAARIDLAAFDKPGTYHVVETLDSGFNSVRPVKGYLRDDEIADGKAGHLDYVWRMRKEIAELRGRKTDYWKDWLDLHKTEDKALAALDRLAADIDAVEKAKKVEDFAGHIAPIERPAVHNGVPMVLGQKVGDRSARRAWKVYEINRENDLKAIQALAAMGVVLEDKPDWGLMADHTAKALAFLKGREKAMLGAIGEGVEKLRGGAVALADKAIKDALAKYPQADPGQMPSAEWLAPTITLSRR